MRNELNELGKLALDISSTKKKWNRNYIEI